MTFYKGKPMPNLRVPAAFLIAATLIAILVACQSEEPPQQDSPPGAAAIVAPTDLDPFDFGDFPACPEDGAFPTHEKFDQMVEDISTGREPTTDIRHNPEFTRLNFTGSDETRFDNLKEFLQSVDDFFNWPDEVYEPYFSCLRRLDDDRVELMISVWMKDLDLHFPSDQELGIDKRLVLVFDTEKEKWSIQSREERSHCGWGISNERDRCLCVQDMPLPPGPSAIPGDGIRVIERNGSFYQQRRISPNTLPHPAAADVMRTSERIHERALLRSQEDLHELCQDARDVEGCRAVLAERLHDIDFDTHAVYFSLRIGPSAPPRVTEAYWVDDILQIHDAVPRRGGCSLGTMDVRYLTTLLVLDRSQIDSVQLSPSEKIYSLSP